VDKELKSFLDDLVEEYNRPQFIEADPIVIPHEFTKLQDIEIAGFFAAILAWGNRKIIINKSRELMARMDHDPYNFIMNHSINELKYLEGFKHRTFNETDLLYFVEFFKQHYTQFESFEDAFLMPNQQFDPENSLNSFKDYFFSIPDFPTRTRKHISSPKSKATCKRINMFLRWMVRKDNKGVDFGVWNRISPADLICPCDVHVDRVARSLNLITRSRCDWLTAIELTERLKEFDPQDPVRYDFALFSLGVQKLI